jgi:hypothetical protein
MCTPGETTEICGPKLEPQASPSGLAGVLRLSISSEAPTAITSGLVAG